VRSEVAVESREEKWVVLRRIARNALVAGLAQEAYRLAKPLDLVVSIVKFLADRVRDLGWHQEPADASALTAVNRSGLLSRVPLQGHCCLNCQVEVFFCVCRLPF
jgi:hypothetical protein